MGRHCGDIALYAGLAGGAENIIVPEVNVDMDEILKKVISGKNRGKLHHIIVLAEGVGDTYELSSDIKSKTGIDTRVTILGYIQRGGTPTSSDRIMASGMGRKAVELLIEGESGKVLGVKCNDIINMDIKEALNIKKEFRIDLYETIQILSI